MTSVSVIIPSHCRPDFLQEAVTSVLEQDWRDFELLVVLDGTPEVSLPADPRLRLISLASARGVAAARNIGARAAVGEYIAFLDDDDLWKPRKLSAQISFFEEHPSAVAVQTEEIWFRRGRRVNPRRIHQKPDGEILPRSLRLCLVSPSAVMLRRRVFDSVGYFDESLPACEDYDYWLRLGLREPVYLIKEQLTVKRGGRPDQLSAQPGLDRWRIQALRKFLNDPLSGPYRQEAGEVLDEKLRIYAQGCMKRGKYNEAETIRAVAG